ncbi:BRCT domain-containing protein [Spatholobus suberectus]|nr:BRCT domain-containing protein [Spatholobus suberectus]
MKAEEHFQLPHQSHASPVQGMERVVATVSGYHGSERFNLIKLISHTGANYVGAMSKSITHLVCWKFEGKKYDIAQKFRILVVNHRWIEDSIREGRRVPEDSYTLQSGREVGPLLLEVPVIVRASSLTKKKLVSDKLHDTGHERQKTNFGSGASGTDVLEDSCLMKRHEESSSYSSRLSRKGKRDICNGRGVSTVVGPSRKGRRLVRNLVDEVVLDPSILDLSPDDRLFRMDRLQTDAAATSSLSVDVNNNIILQNSEGNDAGLRNQIRTINDGSDDIEQIKDSSHISTPRNSTLFIEDPLPMPHTSIDLCSSDDEKFREGDQVDNVAGLPTSTELSCVICFTDFSSTRGILPCGHRFCFPCIQSWVDHRTSMGKTSTCPLCKASFVMIKKVEHAATADQKVYSQTIPCDNSASDIFLPMDQELPDNIFESSQASACVVCRGREPEDLLESCDVCRTRKIHSYCMDPPLRPWTCSHCKELRMLYRSNYTY